MTGIEHYLKPGLHHSDNHTLKEKELASTVKIGNVDVVTTPALIVLLEQVICNIIHERIPPEYTTVSAEINIKHLIPVFKNAEVTCSIHLKFVEKEKLFFDFAIFDTNKDIIAIGAHERYVIAKNKFDS